MATIQDCAILYQSLLNKEYVFTLQGDIQFKIYFPTSHFYHLMGLEKLTDIVQLKNKKANQIYNQILKGNLSNRIIHNSNLYHLIDDRVQYFNQLPDLLTWDKSNKVIVDFDKNKLPFSSKLSNTRYILYKRSDIKHIHLTIGNKKKLYPETFIVENGNTYISEQILLDILDIQVIKR